MEIYGFIQNLLQYCAQCDMLPWSCIKAINPYKTTSDYDFILAFFCCLPFTRHCDTVTSSCKWTAQMNSVAQLHTYILNKCNVDAIGGDVLDCLKIKSHNYLIQCCGIRLHYTEQGYLFLWLQCVWSGWVRWLMCWLVAMGQNLKFHSPHTVLKTLSACRLIALQMNIKPVKYRCSFKMQICHNEPCLLLFWREEAESRGVLEIAWGK